MVSATMAARGVSIMVPMAVPPGELVDESTQDRASRSSGLSIMSGIMTSTSGLLTALT
jgi:hypothetical protein